MAKLKIQDIYPLFEDEIEKEFQLISQECGNNSMRKSACFVGSMQRISRKIALQYGRELFDFDDVKFAAECIYSLLYDLTKDLQHKYKV